MNANRILKIAVVIVLTVAITLGIPETFAKYSDTKNFEIVIDYTPTVKKKTATSRGESNYQTISFTAEHDGYYAIIIRGANGEKGLRKADDFVDNAGVGGYVYACVYAKSGDAINAYVGNAPTIPEGRNTNPGKNSRGVAVGGKGSTINLSTETSSGSGGAATVVTVNNVVVAVAAGGGGGGGCDKTSALVALVARDGAKGGNGGYIGGTSISSNGYIVYSGSDGDYSEYSYTEWFRTYKVSRSGAGGTDSAGSHGISGSGKGTDGSVINLSNLTGGAGGNGESFGGGGGGGYAGGGGGAGNGDRAKAGGGGGGSSAILLSNAGKSTLKLNSTALTKIFTLAGYSSDFGSYSGGFAIVAYLNNGTDTSPYSGGTF